MKFEITYKLENGPAAQSFEVYEKRATAEYRQLLESPATDEAGVQSFIEQNPCFAPKASPDGSEYPIFGALISQPTLPGLRSKRPDFLLMTWNSAYWFPTFIEIEHPAKRLFKTGGVPTYQFTEARNQLAQWRAWISEPANRQKFVNDYGIPHDHLRFRDMDPRFVLIYGRRANSRRTRSFQSIGRR
jgi:Domain of unknown function (DUF4263)